MDPFTLLMAALTDAATSATTAIGSTAADAGSALGLGTSPATATANGVTDAANTALAPAAETAPPVPNPGAPAPAAGAPAAPGATPAANPSWFRQGYDALNSAAGSPLGKVLSASSLIKPAQPQFSGGFQGPHPQNLSQIHALDPSAAMTAAAATGKALGGKTLGQMLAESPIGKHGAR